jgi:hypothetical protein
MVRWAVREAKADRSCACPRALEGSILTAADRVGEEARRRLHLLLGKYLGELRP